MKIEDSDFWIIDSTEIYEKKLANIIFSSKKQILLSPKFKLKKTNKISHAILRSDPFKLKVKNKFVSSSYLIYNKGEYEKKSEYFCLGIALSGSDVSEKITSLINSIINENILSSKINSIKTFLGSSQEINFDRKNENSYFIDLEFISSFSSLWKFKHNFNLLIVGNGTIVDECILEKQDFLLYNYNDGKIKSPNYDLIKENEVKDLISIKNYLESYFSKNKSNCNTNKSISSHSSHFMIKKLKEIIRQ